MTTYINRNIEAGPTSIDLLYCSVWNSFLILVQMISTCLEKGGGGGSQKVPI
jgi:hypothetical protein